MLAIIALILFTSGTKVVHANHNITAALVALAPITEDTETILFIDTSANTGSDVTSNWLYISMVTTFSILVIRICS